MGTKAGVWIDHRKAVVVLLSEDGTPTTTTIESGVVPPSRASEGKHRFHESTAEDTIQRQEEHEYNIFYDHVIAALAGAEAVLVFGPAQAKGEFRKRCEAKSPRTNIVAVETSDKLTDPQIVAKVRHYFEEAAAATEQAARKRAAS